MKLAITEVVVHASGEYLDIYWEAEKGEVEISGMETVPNYYDLWWIKLRINRKARAQFRIEKALSIKPQLVGKRWSTWW